MKIVWTLFFLIISLHILFHLNVKALEKSKEDDDEQFDIDIEDFILQDFLSEDINVSDSHTVHKLLDRYLQGVMRRYRTKVLKLYRKMTCSSDQLCDPFTLIQQQKSSDTSFIDEENTLDFRVEDIRRVAHCPSLSPSTFAIVPRGDFNVLVAAALSSSVVYLYQVKNDGFCSLIGQFETSLPPPLQFHPLAIEEQLQLIAVWSQHSSNIRIYELTDSGLENSQLLQATNIRNVFGFNYLGSHFISVLSEDLCMVYLWSGLNFELICQKDASGVSLGNKPEIFFHGDGVYLLSIHERTKALLVHKAQAKPNEMEFELFQVLSECNTAENFHHFQLVAGLQFVVVACEDFKESYLYWWSGNQFLMWQIIAPSVQTLSWTSMRLENGEILLLGLHSEPKKRWLQTYSLSDGHYKISTAAAYVMDDASAIGSMPSSNLIYAITETQSLHFYRVMLSVKDIKVEREDEEKSLDHLEMLLDRQQQLYQDLNASLKIFEEKKYLAENLEDGCELLFAEMKSIESSIKAIDADLNNLNQHHGFSEIKVGDLIVTKYLEAAEVVVKDEMINGINLEQMEHITLSKSKSQTFDSDVVVDGNFHVESFQTKSSVNGVHYQHIAKTKSPVTFTRPQTFRHSLSVNGVVKLDGLLNNINTSDIVTTNSSSVLVIHGRKVVKSLKINGNLRLRGGKINNVNIDKLFAMVTVNEANKDAKSELVVEGDVIIKGALLTNLINGINVGHLASNIVTKSAQEIAGDWSLRTLNVKDLSVAGRINGVKLSEDLLTVKTEQRIQHPVTIRGSVRVLKDILVASGIVNGVNNWASSIITQTGQQSIRGRKVFVNGLAADEIEWPFASSFGDVTVDHLFAGSLNQMTNLSSVFSSFIQPSKPYQTLHGQLKCSRTIFEGTIIESHDGPKLHEAYLTTSTVQNVTTPLVLLADELIIVDGDLSANTLNGISFQNVAQDCLFKDGDQTLNHFAFDDVILLGGIHLLDHQSLLQYLLNTVDWRLSNLELWGDVYMEGDLNTQFLNGIDLDSFLSKIYSINDYFHLSDKFFTHLSVSGDFELNVRLNGVNSDDVLQNVVRLSTQQNITGDIRMNRPTYFSGSSLKARLVNTFNLEDRLSQLAQLDSEGVLQKPITFINNFEVYGNAYIQKINAENVSKIFDSILLHSQQQFENAVTMSGKITIGELFVEGTINGVQPSDWLTLNDNRTFNGKVVFKAKTTFSTLVTKESVQSEVGDEAEFEEISANEVRVSGSLNGVDIESLPKQILRKSNHDVITNSQVIFRENISAEHLTTLSEGGGPMVNGINLSEIVSRGLTSHTHQIIHGQMTFASEVRFEDDAEVRGHFQTADRATGNGMGGWTHFGNVSFEDDLIVAGIEKWPTHRYAIEVNGSVDVSHLTLKAINAMAIEDFMKNSFSSTSNNYSLVQVKDSSSGKGVVGCKATDWNKDITIEEDIEFRCAVSLDRSLHHA